MSRVIKTPEIVGPLGADGNLRIHTSRVALKTSTAMAVGDWLVVSSGVWTPMADAADVVDYVLLAIETEAGQRKEHQWLTSSDSAQHYGIVAPIGGLIFRMSEDALVTPITDANSGDQGRIYADIQYTAATDTSTSGRLFGSATPTYQIDSDSVNSSSSNRVLELLGVAPTLDNNAYSATAGAAPRQFLAKVIDAAAGYHQ